MNPFWKVVPKKIFFSSLLFSPLAKVPFFQTWWSFLSPLLWYRTFNWAQRVALFIPSFSSPGVFLSTYLFLASPTFFVVLRSTRSTCSVANDFRRVPIPRCRWSLGRSLEVSDSLREITARKWLNESQKREHNVFGYLIHWSSSLDTRYP